MREHRSLRVVVLAVAVALAAGAVACGEQGGEVGAGDPGFLSQAVAKLQDASTGRIGGEFSVVERPGPPPTVGEPYGPDGVDGPGAGQPDLVTQARGDLEGSFDLDASRSMAAMTVTEFETTRTRSGDPEVGERYELIRDGDDVYEREIRADGEARPWRKRSTPEFDVVGRAMFFGISSYGFTDPETLVRQLDAGAVEMAEVGSGEVRGVEVTTFRVSLSAARLAEMAVEDLLAAGTSGAYGTTWPVERADYEDEIALLEGIVIDTVVSIGGDGFIRAVETNLDGGELDRRVEEARNRAGATERRSSLGDLQIWYRFELYDFGEPVSIELPDPSEVSDGSDRYDDIDCRVNDSGTYECFEEVGEAIEMEGEQSGNVTIVTDPASGTTVTILDVDVPPDP